MGVGVGPGPPTPAPSPSVFPICTTVSETPLHGSVAPAGCTELMQLYVISSPDIRCLGTIALFPNFGLIDSWTTVLLNHILKCSRGFYFTKSRKSWLHEILWFKFHKYVAGLVLRPVTNKCSWFPFSWMLTNLWNMRNLIHHDNLNVHSNFLLLMERLGHLASSGCN